MGGKLIKYGNPTNITPKNPIVISEDSKDNKIVTMTGKQLRQMVSVIQSRANLAGLLGQTFGGERDVYEVLGYKKTLVFQDYYNRFKRDNIAKRIVSARPKATWANHPTLKAKEDGDNKRPIKEFKKTWDRLNIKRRLLAKVSRADVLSGIGTFGILLLGINDGRDLSSPLGRAKTKDGDKSTGLLYASAYSENDVDIKEYDDNVKSPRFGLPKMYTVNAAGGLNTVPSSLIRSLDIHYSRVVHIAEGLLENEIFGTPRLEAVYNLFDDLAKVTGGSAEFFWKTADRGIHWDINKDMEIEQTNEDELGEEVDAYEHGLKRNVKTRGITSKVLGSETADPRGPFTSIISLIAGTEGVPQRILLGSERGQLASAQDRSSWNELIGERQITYAEPQILRPTIDILIEAEILEDIEYDVEWPVIFPQTEDEKSTIAQRSATAAKTASQQVVGSAVITPEEFGERYLNVENPPDNEADKKEEQKLEEKKEKNKLALVPDPIKDDGDIEESPGEQQERTKNEIKDKKASA